jgi:molybdopterin-synthase adenylyltransferase
VDREQLQRYSRHILLPQIDIAGQERLLGATALIIGLGGLGSPAAMYLASSGVGRLVLNDHDVVEPGNLQRQILHATNDLGRPKTESARDRLQALNPGIELTTLDRRLTDPELAREAARADVVLDATDNFIARFAVNRACKSAGTPLVWGAVIRLQGQAATFDFRRNDSPCLACLYPEHERDEAEDTCAAAGVLAPLAGLVGCLMATEALKVLLDFGDTLCGRLARIDAADMTWRQSRLPRDPHCDFHNV